MHLYSTSLSLLALLTLTTAQSVPLNLISDLLTAPGVTSYVGALATGAPELFSALTANNFESYAQANPGVVSSFAADISSIADTLPSSVIAGISSFAATVVIPTVSPGTGVTVISGTSSPSSSSSSGTVSSTTTTGPSNTLAGVTPTTTGPGNGNAAATQAPLALGLSGMAFAGILGAAAFL